MPIVEAGGRMYMDVSFQLASPMGRVVKGGLGSVDILIQKALTNVLKRKDSLCQNLARGKATMGLNGGTIGRIVAGFTGDKNQVGKRRRPY